MGGRGGGGRGGAALPSTARVPVVPDAQSTLPHCRLARGVGRHPPSWSGRLWAARALLPPARARNLLNSPQFGQSQLPHPRQMQLLGQGHQLGLEKSQEGKELGGPLGEQVWHGSRLKPRLRKQNAGRVALGLRCLRKAGIRAWLHEQTDTKKRLTIGGVGQDASGSGCGRRATSNRARSGGSLLCLVCEKKL